MKWVLKAIVQKIISYLPAKQHINHFFQRYVTRGVILNDQYFSDKLISGIDHLRLFRKNGKPGSFEALELGTGWYPVVPIALFLAGAEKIVSIDISPLLTREGILATIEKFRQWHEENKLGGLTPFILEDRLDLILSLHDFKGDMEELLRRIHLHPEICDARKTEFETASFDLVCSNNTFEHIPEPILAPIIIEFQRILKPEGIMSHFVDMSDHFAHMDQSISIYHFLRFSSKQWKWIDNSIQPQNRMRLRDYEEMYKRIGIPILDTQIRSGSIKAVEAEPIHPEFRNYSLEELAVSHAYVISSKPLNYGIEERQDTTENLPKQLREKF